MAHLDQALRRNVVTAAQPRRLAFLRTEPGALLSLDLGSDLLSSAAGASVVLMSVLFPDPLDASLHDGVSSLKQSSSSTENIMNASSSPLFTDTLKSIPGFFGIRLDTQPAYHIEDLVGKVEIRRYAPSLLAQVSADGSHDAAVALAHEKLADYVYGGNERREKMEMTSPSFQVDGDSMMFPVSVSRHKETDSWRVAFFLSNTLAAREAPLPDDPAIRIRQAPETLVATLRYRGSNTEERRSLAKRELIQALSGSKWAADDRVYWASYDQAFAIPYLTRNEVHVRVVSSSRPRSTAFPREEDDSSAASRRSGELRTDLRETTETCDDDIAVQRAENEGLSIVTPNKAVNRGLFASVSTYLKKGFASSVDEQGRKLEQLLVDLRTATSCDTQLRKRSAPLMALMASDLRDARRFPTQGSLTARPMHAWRQRYNGIDFVQ